jgi:hypothetical protein
MPARYAHDVASPRSSSEYPSPACPAVLERLFFATAVPRSWHQIVWHRDGRRRISHDVATTDLDRYLGLIEYLSETEEVWVSLAPRPRPGWGSASRSNVLWCRAESLKQLERLRAMAARPTIVLREGSTVRHLAVWELDAPVGYEQAVRFNKRLAHAIRAPKKYAQPEELFVPVGACLRDARARPCPIVHAGGSSRVWTAESVVGRLRDAPDPDAWRDGQRTAASA